jgi:hypothetical protein
MLVGRASSLMTRGASGALGSSDGKWGRDASSVFPGAGLDSGSITRTAASWGDHVSTVASRFGTTSCDYFCTADTSWWGDEDTVGRVGVEFAGLGCSGSGRN